MTLSLPVLSSSTSPDADGPVVVPPVDRSKPYRSCEWLEGGLAFNRRSLHACLIVHHGRGFPHLVDFNGGEIPVNKVLAARHEIIRQNQNEGHEACRGCPHLVTKQWPEPKYQFDTIGIAQFTHCNIYCNYCYLQTQDPASYAAGADPYKVMPAFEQMIRDGLMAPDSLIDWGGGEPTIYKEFDPVLEMTTRRGARHWVHTNGTCLPKPLKKGLPANKINILCSVDAGTRETYLKMKKKDFYNLVWKNLAEFKRLGCSVTVKYIMKEDNCTAKDIVPFVNMVRRLGRMTVLIDIDYDYPDPSPEVIEGLRLLKCLCERYRFNSAMGFTGAKFTPELEVESRIYNQLKPRLADRLYELGRDIYWKYRHTRAFLGKLAGRAPGGPFAPRQRVDMAGADTK